MWAAVCRTANQDCLRRAARISGFREKARSNIMASGQLMRIENNSQPTTILIGTVQEKISPRLTLNQGISSQSNNHSFTWGAHWIGNQIPSASNRNVPDSPCWRIRRQAV